MSKVTVPEAFKGFKGGELKMSFSVSGYDAEELEALAERNPEAAAVLIASLPAVTFTDPEDFAKRFPRLAAIWAMRKSNP
jgi:hypothetical protein